MPDEVGIPAPEGGEIEGQEKDSLRNGNFRVQYLMDCSGPFR
jgi:hypothetical protein